MLSFKTMQQAETTVLMVVKYLRPRVRNLNAKHLGGDGDGHTVRRVVIMPKIVKNLADIVKWIKVNIKLLLYDIKF